MANMLQVAGIAAIAIGVGFVFWPAGIVCAGVGAVLFGLALERE